MRKAAEISTSYSGSRAESSSKKENALEEGKKAAKAALQARMDHFDSQKSEMKISGSPEVSLRDEKVAGAPTSAAKRRLQSKSAVSSSLSSSKVVKSSTKTVRKAPRKKPVSLGAVVDARVAAAQELLNRIENYTPAGRAAERGMPAKKRAKR